MTRCEKCKRGATVAVLKCFAGARDFAKRTGPGEGACNRTWQFGNQSMAHGSRADSSPGAELGG